MKAEEMIKIEEIRSYNRFYTDVLGLLNKQIFDSEYSLTESRILFEIAKTPNITANLLMDKLNMDRGYLSRVLKNFQKKDLIIKKVSSVDGRISHLYLTKEGNEVLNSLEQSSNKQIYELLKLLSSDEQEKLVRSMRQIRTSLLNGLYPITIRTYNAKDIEYIIEKHKDIYEMEYGLGPEFVEYVEKYIRHFHLVRDNSKETIWIAESNGKTVGVMGAVMIDESTAQLRWFLIEPEVRGRGLGQILMETAISFCKEKNYSHIILWTLNKLDTARHLYKKYGFRVTDTKENHTWANTLIEERWDLYL